MLKSHDILIENSFFKLTKIEDNILVAHHKDGVMKLKDLMILLKTIKKQETKYGGLFVVNTQDPGFSFSQDAWRYVRKESDNFTFIKAQALVAKLLHFRILAKFHVRVSKGKTNYKVVSSVEEGVEWLKKQMLL